jgi:hypothetical protein
VLLEEFGLEPGLELRRLQEAILAHDPAVVAVAAAPRRRGGLPAPVFSVVDRADAVGQVLERMREHLRRAEELYRLALAVAGFHSSSAITASGSAWSLVTVFIRAPFRRLGLASIPTLR